MITLRRGVVGNEVRRLSERYQRSHPQPLVQPVPRARTRRSEIGRTRVVS